MRHATKLLPFVLLSACHNGYSNGFAVDLVLQLDPALKPSASTIRTLELDVSGGDSDSQTMTPTKLPSGGVEHLVYRPTSGSKGAVTFTATARAADGSDVAFGQGTTTLRAGATTTLTITLGDKLPPAPDFAPPNPAMIAPETVTVPRLATQAFTAGVPVSWSVVEPNGGSIDSAGNYTAPGIIGTYHVVATLTADPKQHSTATITVVYASVQLIAGAPGGEGAIDNTGPDARFGGGEGMITIDGAGNFYLADRNNQTVRRVTPGGVVTTIIGQVGQRSAAGATNSQLLWDPYGVAVNAAGTTLYLSECDNATIARIDYNATTQTWTRTLIAGQPGVTGSGDASSGLNATFGCPVGLALDETHNLLYVVDFANDNIRYLALNGNGASVGTVVGTNTCGSSNTAPVTFCSPIGVAFDGTSALYVADAGNALIRKVALTLGGTPLVPTAASTTTLAGTPGTFGGSDGTATTTPPASFVRPMGIVYANSTYVYVADQVRGGATGGHTIRRITLADGTVTTLAGTSGTPGYKDGSSGTLFNTPSGIALLGATAYVLDSGNFVVRKLVINGSAVTVSTFAGMPSQSGTALANGAGSASRFNGPVNLASDGSGNVFVSDSGNCAVRELTITNGGASGYSATVSTVAGGGTNGTTCGATDGAGASALFSSPQAVAFDGQHTLYVGDASLRAIDLSSATDTVRTIVGLPAAARGLAGDFTADTFYLTLTDNSIIRYDATSAELRRMWGAPFAAGNVDGYGENARFTNASALLLAGGGALYVSDFSNAELRRIDLADNYVTTVAGNKGASGLLSDGVGKAAILGGTCGLTTLPDGRILFADELAHAVRSYDPATQAVQTLVGVLGIPGVKEGSLPGGLSQPCGLALLPTGELVVSNVGEQVVQIVY